MVVYGRFICVGLLEFRPGGNSRDRTVSHTSTAVEARAASGKCSVSWRELQVRSPTDWGLFTPSDNVRREYLPVFPPPLNKIPLPLTLHREKVADQYYKTNVPAAVISLDAWKGVGYCGNLVSLLISACQRCHVIGMNSQVCFLLLLIAFPKGRAFMIVVSPLHHFCLAIRIARWHVRLTHLSHVFSVLRYRLGSSPTRKKIILISLVHQHTRRAPKNPNITVKLLL